MPVISDEADASAGTPGKTSCNFSTSPMRMDAVQSVGMNSRSRNPGNGAGHNSVGLNVRSSNLTTSSLSGFSESFWNM